MSNASVPTKPNRRIPELDGFRVLLVFIVSWYHIWQQSWLTPRIGSVSLDFLLRTGYMPVDGTILLSGFLLFLPWARAMQEGSAVPDRERFYQSRFARIVPSYLFVLLCTLFFIVLPWGLFYSPQFAVKDLFTHLTFTQTFFPDTYMSTPLGVVAWTLCIEWQAYLIFPWLAKKVMKHPLPMLLGMVLCAFAWRGYCIWALSDYGMVVNQLPSFLDVYALGIAGSMVYVRLQRWQPQGKKKWLLQGLATLVLAACLVLLVVLLKAQAKSPDYVTIQRGQMVRRFPYSLLLLGIVLALPFGVRPVRFLMGNKVVGFLATISMNYYLIHQTLAVHLKRLGIPASQSPNPHMAGEKSWQYPYVFLCFGLSILLATIVTYLVEKPAARWLHKRFAIINEKRERT